MTHEKLQVYGQLLKMAEDIAKRVARWPRGYGYLADQLRRAMSSALLTLCEGNGKWGMALERRRFFRMSMGSISEVAACLDLAGIFNLIGEDESARFKGELRHAYYRIRRLP